MKKDFSIERRERAPGKKQPRGRLLHRAEQREKRDFRAGDCRPLGFFRRGATEPRERSSHRIRLLLLAGRVATRWRAMFVRVKKRRASERLLCYDGVGVKSCRRRAD